MLLFCKPHTGSDNDNNNKIACQPGLGACGASLSSPGRLVGSTGSAAKDCSDWLQHMVGSHTRILVGPITCEILKHYAERYSALGSVTLQEPCTARPLPDHTICLDRYPRITNSLLTACWNLLRSKIGHDGSWNTCCAMCEHAVAQWHTMHRTGLWPVINTALCSATACDQDSATE